jgi:hypothetical protein
MSIPTYKDGPGQCCCCQECPSDCSGCCPGGLTLDLAWPAPFDVFNISGIALSPAAGCAWHFEVELNAVTDPTFADIAGSVFCHDLGPSYAGPCRWMWGVSITGVYKIDGVWQPQGAPVPPGSPMCWARATNNSTNCPPSGTWESPFSYGACYTDAGLAPQFTVHCADE